MKKVTVSDQMAGLYKRLVDVGLPKSYVQSQGLPDWWCDEYEQSEGAIVTAAAHLSKRFNLDFQSLLNDQDQPRFILSSQPKYKLQNGIDPQNLPVPSSIAAKIAEIVASACKLPYQPIEKLSVAEIRAEILDSSIFVDLKSLLNFCWSRGIPVVHFDQFPRAKGIKKFQGMVACFHQRPVIVLSLNDSSPSRLLFIVAHELGHILKGHLSLTNTNLLVDEEVKQESKDPEEVDANEVASELLLGQPNKSYATERNYTAKQLCEYAREVGYSDEVSPGVVVQNYGWHKNHWGSATAALKLLEPHANAPQQVNRRLLTNLDWDNLGNDYEEYLELSLGLDRG